MLVPYIVDITITILMQFVTYIKCVFKYNKIALVLLEFAVIAKIIFIIINKEHKLEHFFQSLRGYLLEIEFVFPVPAKIKY